MNMGKKILPPIFVLLLIFDQGCCCFISAVFIVCGNISLLIFILINWRFIVRKVTKLYDAFPTQSGMYVTIGIVHSLKGYMTTFIILKVDVYSAFIYYAAVYFASAFLFRGYFKRYEAYLNWALITNVLAIFTGKWRYSLLTPFWLSLIKSPLKKSPASKFFEALWSHLPRINNNIVCFPATVEYLADCIPGISSLWDLRVRVHTQIPIQADPDDIILGQEENISFPVARRPTEETPAEDVALSVITNPGSRETTPLLDVRNTLTDLAEGIGENSHSTHTDSGIASLATGHTSNTASGYAITSGYHSDRIQHGGFGNTTHTSFPRDYEQDTALELRYAVGGNTNIISADGGVSTSDLPNNDSIRPDSNGESGPDNKLYESITLLKQVWPPREPVDQPEDESANNSDDRSFNSHTFYHDHKNKNKTRKSSESDEDHEN